MSGICGIVHLDGAPVAPEGLDALVLPAMHRARDGVGQWVHENVGLAHLRTHVTPESLREAQPLADSSGAVVLVASVRLDNRDDLIRVLSSSGHLRDGGATDAALILSAYERWGTECAAHLIGDFAFAIWDSRRRGLFAARDPMGFRALYYRHSGSRLLFASEAKQLIASNGSGAGLNEAAIAMHLAQASHPPDWTFFEGVAQLPAGQALWFDGAGVRSWRFWDPDPERRIEYGSEEQYWEHFREIFEEAVRSRLRSYRPVGVWLSGGLDSGSVASTAGWLRERNGNGDLPRIHAYSWSFETLPECDERHISDRIVERFGFEPTYISAERFAPFSECAAVVTDADEPLVQVYTPLLQRALETAREQGVGLILSGFRGDPMAESGQFDYVDLMLTGQWLRAWRHLATYRRRVPEWPLSRLIWDRFLQPFGDAAVWTPALAWAAYPLRELVRGHSKPFPARPFPSWVRDDLARRVGLRRLVQRPRAPVELKGLARRDRYRSIFFPLFARAAVEQERHNATMGIGYADPWSDRRLVEFILSVPQHIVSRIGDEKRITRQAMRGVMPEEARRRAGKIVPTPVYHRMIREGAREAITALFTNSQLAARGLVDEAELRKSYDVILRGEESDPRIWYTVTAELWLRRHWS